MSTVRIDIAYRPLRIGWVIASGDFTAFREAVRLSYALWGGCFNPILVADDEFAAVRLIDLFRIDFLIALSDTDHVKAFAKKFHHLPYPFFDDSLFSGGTKTEKRANVLDVHNALEHMRHKPEHKKLMEIGVRFYNWQHNDPLSDLFLVNYGEYPDANKVGINYRQIVQDFFEPIEIALDAGSPIPFETPSHPSIACLSRHALKRHYEIRPGFSRPGFFVGSAGNLDDLISYWNLRAADISLVFIDTTYQNRFSDFVLSRESELKKSMAQLHDQPQGCSMWGREEELERAKSAFPTSQYNFIRVSEHTWSGRNVRPPMMHFGEVSVLGAMEVEFDKPKISFSLSEKPFCGGTWFHSQHLIASISILSGSLRDDQYTLNPPYLPELNEFYARSMHFGLDRFRSESERVGIVIQAADSDSFLNALSVQNLVNKVFDLAGYSTKLSTGGLIARQVIKKMGGLQGVRAFKIPGVRRLLKTHGPTGSFSKSGAIQLVSGIDQDNKNAKFSDHENLHIERRSPGEKLSANVVFAHLVEKGLFRIGYELDCPNCQMSSWTALDNLKQTVVCDLCGHEHDATRQLVNKKWAYRRSGILGAEKNAQGAIPVALTLQQLQINLAYSPSETIYSVSIDLTKAGTHSNECEIDFVWIIPRPYPRRTAIILGECKDRGPIKLEEFKKDVENLRRVANSFPINRFKPFILLSKLSAFTDDEVQQAKLLNSEQQHRVILLTDRELEPYDMYERTKKELDINYYEKSPEGLAQVTSTTYFGA